MTVAVGLLILASALVGAVGEVMTRSLRDRVDRAGSTVDDAPRQAGRT
ncbi:hypothetical protein [Kitasatospora purpeofusca]|uniref:Uncharacterized protein n=1 Tax=Kitasatospora purpeofusca TaxID=67352 RepID=A0ABZ1U1S9_9ACTN|nr:hypothetical protein [Kitasatospora purpeofusca]